MFKFIKFLQADYNNIPSTYHEEYNFEHQFNYYYQTTVKAQLNRAINRQQFFRALLKKKIKLSLFFIALLIILISFWPIEFINDHYQKLADYYNNIMLLYNSWWAGLAKSYQFILPAKLIIWSFPPPTILVTIILVLILINCLIIILKYPNSLNDQLKLIICCFKADFKYQNSNYDPQFLNQLLLKHYLLEVQKDNIVTTYKNIQLNLSEFKILAQEKLINGFSIKRIKLNGLLITADLSNFLKNQFTTITKNKTKVVISPKIFDDLVSYNKYKNEINIETNQQGSANIKLLEKIAELIYSSSNNLPSNQNRSIDEKLLDYLNHSSYSADDSNTASFIQCIIHDQQLMLIVNHSVGLFEKQSLFKPLIQLTDIRCLLMTIELMFNLIDIILENKK